MPESGAIVGATAALALTAWVATTASSFAITGAGCPDLPEYYRALGTLQMGPGACNMTVEEAKRVLAREGQEYVDQGYVGQAEPRPAPHRHHRHKTLRP